MGRCFVIQPFDNGGPFDKRYEDIIVPAVKDAGLEPYRVDRDPAVNIPIDDIEKEIKNAAVCIVDITVDNPNVWFELGYAIATKKLVILICSDQRTSHFPFDVQHRKITRYKTDSPQDFEKLKKEITERINLTIKAREKIDVLSAQTSIVTIEGLAQHELMTLVTVASNIDGPTDWISTHTLIGETTRVGFTNIAVNLAISSLVEKGFLKIDEAEDEYGRIYTVYMITKEGMSWLMKNTDKLTMKDPLFSDPFLSELDDDEK